MRRLTPSKIRNNLLKERGLVSSQPSPKKHHRLRLTAFSKVSDKLKTPKMRYLELKYHQPIEKLLLSGSLSIVAKKLGNEVDTSTLSRWIKKLKLRYSPGNLPVCDKCKHEQTQCSYGACIILMDLELWELTLLKKNQMLGIAEEVSGGR